MSEREVVTAEVIVVSDRAAKGVRPDRTAELLRPALEEQGADPDAGEVPGDFPEILEHPLRTPDRFHFPGNPMIHDAQLPGRWETWRRFWGEDG